MREKQIENKLAMEVKKAGGIALKFVSPSFDGMPDRLVGQRPVCQVGAELTGKMMSSAFGDHVVSFLPS